MKPYPERLWGSDGDVPEVRSARLEPLFDLPLRGSKNVQVRDRAKTLGCAWRDRGALNEDGLWKQQTGSEAT